MTSQWPPRSPHEALLATPSGRERLRRLAERQSPTPSPSRASRCLSALPNDEDEDDDDDDEEVLQLKLQAIEAKLRLKKLKAARAKAAESSLEVPGSVPSLAQSGSREESKISAARDRMEKMQQAAALVQVPASPVKRQPVAHLQTSPQRVVLGIDKGMRAADVSLKRPPSKNLRRAESRLTFNERLAAARSDESGRLEREQKLRQLRSTGFSVGKQEMEDYKNKAVDVPQQPFRPREYTRDEIIAVANEPEGKSAVLSESSTSSDGFEPYSALHLSKRILPHGVLTRAITGMKTYLIKDLLRNVKGPNWCLPDEESDIVVFAIIAGKSDARSHLPRPGKPKEHSKYMVITLVDLSYEVDLFLFKSGFDRFWKLTPGTVLAILNPNIIPPPPGREATGRFGLVINSDADTILEIGNARDLGYCKSVKKDGQLCGSWINARHTEYCEFHTNEAVRKSRTNRMEFNTTGFGEVSRSRKYVSGDAKDRDGPKSNYDRSAQSHYFVSGAHRNVLDDEREGGMADRVEREDALKRRLQRQERERDIVKRLAATGGAAGKDYMAAIDRSAALSSSISSTAAASSQTRLTDTRSSSTENLSAQKLDAKSLGLTGRVAPRVSLASVKRKRPESSSSSLASGSSGALGWGSSLKDKLARMKEGEKLDGKMAGVPSSEAGTMSSVMERSGPRSPVRKKTRFVTEKGIREAGRESLGEPLSAAAKSRRQVILDDDDDDLIIVK